MLINRAKRLESVKVTKHGTIRCVMYGFLLVYLTLSQRRTVFEILNLTLKPGLGVTQGHRNRHEWIPGLWLHINVLSQPRACLVQFPR